MDFVSAISAGASVKFTTDEFGCKFIQTVAQNPHNWIDRVSHHFVGQCFRAVGMNFKVSLDAFRKTYDHPYRDDNLTYIFNAVPFVLNGVEAFLQRLPSVLHIYELELAKDRPTARLGAKFYELTRPVPCYLRVVDVWTQVVRYITENLQHTDNTVDKFLCEPLARLSVSMLCGLVKLLPDSEDRYDHLKDMCLRLAVLARYGIFYEETFGLILEPMLDIFTEHFQLFCGQLSALRFIYSVFSCEMPDKTGFIKIYKFLTTMLNKFADEQLRNQQGVLYLRQFTDELVTDKFLVIQFEMLKEHNSGPLILATLQYLLTLQSHVASAELFPLRFLEEILLVLVHSTSTLSIRSLAAQLYVRLARRQFHDQEIVVHIIEVFLKTQFNSRKCASYDQAIACLKSYLKELMPHFSALQYFDYYLKVIMAKNVRNVLALFSAHAVYALFELYTEQYADLELARVQIHNFLRKWPLMLEHNSSRLDTRAVIFSIYSTVDFKSIAQHEFELLCGLERFTVATFLDDNTLSDVQSTWLFSNICRSIEVTGNEELLVTVAQKLQRKHAEVSLGIICEQGENLDELQQAYAQCVRRLYALLKVDKLRGHQVADMYEILAAQLLKGHKLNQHMSPIGYECLALMLSLLHREQEQNEDEEYIQVAEQLHDICVRELQSSSQELPQLKSLFCSVIIILLAIPRRLTLTARTYDVLLDQISVRKLASKARANTIDYSYIREMHTLFRDLHENKLIKLPGNRIWKLLLLYKTLKAKPDFISPELDLLIRVLIKQRFDIYAYSLAVIHLHIVNECSNKAKVVSVLKAHQQLVEQNASPKDVWLFRLYVFITALELLVHRSATDAVRPRNHLLPLQYLLPLVDTLFLERNHFMNIARLLHSLKANTFNASDSQHLEVFITQISSHKYRCEDKQSGKVQESELMPQPMGPFSMWQAEAFGSLIEADI